MALVACGTAETSPQLSLGMTRRLSLRPTTPTETLVAEVSHIAYKDKLCSS